MLKPPNPKPLKFLNPKTVTPSTTQQEILSVIATKAHAERVSAESADRTRKAFNKDIDKVCRNDTSNKHADGSQTE